MSLDRQLMHLPLLKILRRIGRLALALILEGLVLASLFVRRLFRCPVTPGQDSPLPAMIRSLCERAGGIFPKLGQLLSTRTDILPSQICSSLAGLQNQALPMEPAVLGRVLSPVPLRTRFSRIELEPVASATIAQVHRAFTVNEQRLVALKVIRPTILDDIRIDVAIAKRISRILSGFKHWRAFPIAEALADAEVLLLRQCDFATEANNLRRLGDAFQDWPEVWVPQVYLDLCSDEILCMEFIPGLRKLNDPSIPKLEAKNLLALALRALYKMIFEDGFVHCDLHPGNMMVAHDGRLVLLDAGLVVDVDDDTRQAFAHFFAAVALGNGHGAAQIVRLTARTLPADLDVDSFDDAIANWVIQASRKAAKDFQIVTFVAGLFHIQQEYGVLGTSSFTMMILALLVLEGTATEISPDLDFQAEALPFVTRTLLKTRNTNYPTPRPAGVSYGGVE